MDGQQQTTPETSAPETVEPKLTLKILAERIDEIETRLLEENASLRGEIETLRGWSGR